MPITVVDDRWLLYYMTITIFILLKTIAVLLSKFFYDTSHKLLNNLQINTVKSLVIFTKRP